MRKGSCAVRARAKSPGRLSRRGFLRKRAIGHIDEAAQLFEVGLKKQAELFGENSWQAAEVHDSLAIVKRAKGELKPAERHAREAVRISRIHTPDHYSTGYFHISLALTLTARGKHAEAETEVETALEIYAVTLPPDHPYIAAAEYALGEVLLAQNRLTEAETVLVASLNRSKRADIPSWRTARSASALGEALYRQGRLQEAELHIVESYPLLATASGVNPEARKKALERVTRLFLDRGQRKELDKLLESTNQRIASKSR